MEEISILDEIHIIESVASALRQMENPPDYLLACEDVFPWEINEICGIPVVYSSSIFNTNTDDDVFFIPLWKKQDDYTIEVTKFNRGYIEC